MACVVYQVKGKQDKGVKKASQNNTPVRQNRGKFLCIRTREKLLEAHWQCPLQEDGGICNVTEKM